MDAFVAICGGVLTWIQAILMQAIVLEWFPETAQWLRSVRGGKILTGTPADPDIRADCGTVLHRENVISGPDYGVRRGRVSVFGVVIK